MMKPGHAMASAIVGALLTCTTHAAAETIHVAALGGGILWQHPAGTAGTPAQQEVPMQAEIRVLPAPTVRIGEVVHFPVLANRAGYAHLFVSNPSGTFVTVAANQPLAAGHWQEINAGPNASIVAQQPAGRSLVSLLVTAMPLDLQAHPGLAITHLESMLAAVPRSSWAIARIHVDVIG